MAPRAPAHVAAAAACGAVVNAYGTAFRALPSDLRKLHPALQVFTVATVAGITLFVELVGDERNVDTAVVDGLLHACICVYMALMVSRRVSMFVWGLVMSAAYLAMAVREELWGQVGLHAFFVCIQPFGVYGWCAARDDDTGVVDLRRRVPCMPAVAVVLYGAVAAFLIALATDVEAVDAHTAGALTIMDAFLAAVGVAAQIMTLARVSESFVLWIAGNVVGVAMGVHLGLWKVTAGWATFLLYSLVGVREWCGAGQEGSEHGRERKGVIA